MTGESDVVVEWLEIAGDAAAWRAIGLVVDESGLIPLHGTSLRVVPPARSDRSDEVGLVGWALSGLDASDDGAQIDDGLPTRVVDRRPPVFADHPLGANGLDHVVVMTADLERTSSAIGIATGHELRRIREVGEMRQGFHRMGRGGLIVELVTRPEIPAGPGRFWGLVINVDDIDAACDVIGPALIGPPKEAVQPGRRIATVRREAGLGLPVALMTT